jgi:hypothetical protein
VVVGHAMDRFDADGRLNDPNLEEQVGEIVRALTVETVFLTPEKVAA